MKLHNFFSNYVIFFNYLKMKDENEKVVPNERMIDEELKEIAKSIDLSDWKKLKKMTAQSFFKKFSLMDDEKIKNYFENSEIIFQKNMLIPEYIKKYYFLEVNSFLKNPTCEENQISNIQSEAKKLKIELKKFNGKYKTKKELCKEIQRKKNFPSEATNFSKSESTENNEYFIEENSDYGNSENNLELIKKFGYEKWNDMNNLDIIKFYKKYHTFSNEEIEESLKNVAKENGISNWKELKKMTLISFVKNFPDENENLNEILEINNLEMIKKFGYEKWNDMNKLDIIKFYKKYHTFSIEEIEETLKDVAKENGISNWKELKKMTLISFLKKFPDEKENLNNKMANNLELIKKCNNYTFDEVEQEAERSGIDLLKSDGTIKTKKELCKEIVEYDILCENINSQKTIIPRNNSCKKVKKIKNCKTTNSLSNKIRSRSPSPIRISSKSFSNKSDCMKHLKSPIEQEAKRLGISLKDDCGKNKTKQQLCDEIEKKSSRCETFKSPKLNKKKEIQKEALFFEIDLKNKNGKEKTINQLENEIYDKINSMKPDSDDEEEREEDEDLFYQKKTCMRNSKKNIEKEAKKFDVNILDKKKKQKTKDSLCREISNKKESMINEIISSSKKLNISIPELPSRQNCCTNFEEAATKGHLECLKDLHKNFLRDKRKKNKKNYGDWNSDVTWAAAYYGHLDCLKYAHENKCPWEESTFEAASEKGNLEILKYLFEENCPRIDVDCTILAARNGHLDCLEFFYERDFNWDASTCSQAARNGHLNCLKFAHENGCEWDTSTCEEAASNGHLDCLKYTREIKKKCPWDKDECFKLAIKNNQTSIIEYIKNLNKKINKIEEKTCSLSPTCKICKNCEQAAAAGHLECLKYYHLNGCDDIQNKNICAEAAKNGHLECLKYAHYNRFSWYRDTCHNSASKGHLDCLKYAHKNGCPWNEETCKFAVTNGHFECFAYAVENNCPWDKKECLEIAIEKNDQDIIKYIEIEIQEFTEYPIRYLRDRVDKGYPAKNRGYYDEELCEQAAKKGFLDILQYLHENGYSWNWKTCKNAAKNGHLKCLKYAGENDCSFYSDLTSLAARNGHLDILQYLYSLNFPWHGNTCSEAARNRHLDCLKFARENGCPWDASTCKSAVESGSLEILKYARENGCPWDEKIICSKAALSGNLKMLIYARENGCPWDAKTCENAASGNGSLEILKYAHENNCPWDSKVFKQASRFGNLDCLQYAAENDCSWHKDTCRYASFYGHLGCLRYAIENGCPWNEKECLSIARKQSNTSITYYIKSLCHPEKEIEKPRKIAKFRKNGKKILEKNCKYCRSCGSAATNGHVDCLEYLHIKEKLSWTKNTAYAAYCFNNLDCLKYAIKNGCPLSKEIEDIKDEILKTK